MCVHIHKYLPTLYHAVTFLVQCLLGWLGCGDISRAAEFWGVSGKISRKCDISHECPVCKKKIRVPWCHNMRWVWCQFLEQPTSISPSIVEESEKPHNLNKLSCCTAGYVDSVYIGQLHGCPLVALAYSKFVADFLARYIEFAPGKVSCYMVAAYM